VGGLLGFGALGYGGEGAFGRQWPLELCQRRAQRVEARGARKSIFFDGAADGGRHRGVFGVGKINRRHGLAGFYKRTIAALAMASSRAAKRAFMTLLV